VIAGAGRRSSGARSAVGVDAQDEVAQGALGLVVLDLAGAGRRMTAAAIDSISSPMSVRDERSTIDLPVAKTVFCSRSPHRTWIEMLHCGYIA
jgi:hypothetical protein